jgi:hypothetical protein
VLEIIFSGFGRTDRITLKASLHGPLAEIARMPAESLIEEVGRMPPRCIPQRPAIVVLQGRSEMRMGALLDDESGSLAWCQPAQVAKPLFRDDDLDVVLRVVHVGDHRHDA